MAKNLKIQDDVRNQIEGTVSIEVIYPDGKHKTIVVQNRIVAQGRDFLLRNLIGVDTVSVDYIVFSDSDAPVNDNETSVVGSWKHGVLATKSHPEPRKVVWSCSLNGDSFVGVVVRSIALATNPNGNGEFSRVILDTPIMLGHRVQVNVNYEVTIS